VDSGFRRNDENHSMAAHLRRLGYPAVHLDGRVHSQDAGFQMKLL
jgi:hypothetical protein